MTESPTGPTGDVGTHADRGVSTLELFFDLVFVFGITQVTAYLSDDHSPLGFLQGLLLLVLLWWAWVGYAWLGTTADLRDGGIRFAIFTAMAGILVVAIGMPEWFADDPGGFDGTLPAPLIVAVAYVVVRLANMAIYWRVAGGDRDLLRAVGRLSMSIALAGAFVIVGALFGGTTQLVLVGLAVLIDLAGPLVGRGAGWVVSPGHFAERHGLIVIIALGESIVAIGVGAAGAALSAPIVVAAAAGVAVAGRLWMLYFDSNDTALEHSLKRRSGAAQAEQARDVYSYLHLVMVAGIVLIALGLKKVLFEVAEYGWGHALPGYAAVAFAVGVALFVLSRQFMRLRSGLAADGWSWVAAATAIVLAGAGFVLPAVVTALAGFLTLHIARAAVPADSAHADA
ncbi:MAG: low temperature requirement protein A [Candidatus Nanopelagicales bacterium]